MRTMPDALLPLPLLFFVAATTAADFARPRGAVEAYITGVSTGSGSHVREAFSEDAKIQYYNGDDEFRSYSRAEFAELVDSGESWEAEIRITNLLRTGRAANATVEFTWGEDGQHGYVDYLNLIYADGSWRITDKVAQYVARGQET